MLDGLHGKHCYGNIHNDSNGSESLDDESPSSYALLRTRHWSPKDVRHLECLQAELEQIAQDRNKRHSWKRDREHHHKAEQNNELHHVVGVTWVLGTICLSLQIRKTLHCR